MKNHADAPIFHKVVCAGAANHIYRSLKSAYVDFKLRSLRKTRSGMEDDYEDYYVRCAGRRQGNTG